MVSKQGSRGIWLHASAALFALLVGIGALAVSTHAGALFGRGSDVSVDYGQGVVSPALARADVGLRTRLSGPERIDSCPSAYTISEATGAQIVPGTSLVPGSRC